MTRPQLVDDTRIAFPLIATRGKTLYYEMVISIDRRVAIYIILYAVSPKLLLPYVSNRDKGNRVGFRVED